MADGTLDIVASLAAVEIRPGDTVVLMYPLKLHADDLRYMAEQLNSKFPENPVLVLDEGMTIGVVRPAAS